jgi:hypothetical protein
VKHGWFDCLCPTLFQVSAITGRVVRIEHENARQEAAEKKKESKEKPD